MVQAHAFARPSGPSHACALSTIHERTARAYAGDGSRWRADGGGWREHGDRRQTKHVVRQSLGMALRGVHGGVTLHLPTACCRPGGRFAGGSRLNGRLASGQPSIALAEAFHPRPTVLRFKTFLTLGLGVAVAFSPCLIACTLLQPVSAALASCRCQSRYRQRNGCAGP